MITYYHLTKNDIIPIIRSIEGGIFSLYFSALMCVMILENFNFMIKTITIKISLIPLKSYTHNNCNNRESQKINYHLNSIYCSKLWSLLIIVKKVSRYIYNYIP